MEKIVDVWMQHPTARHLADEMFASLWRGTAKTPRPSVIAPEMTIAAMDQGRVSVALAAAWCAPHGWMISHDEVAAIASAYPERILGVASANLDKPMEAVRELRDESKRTLERFANNARGKARTDHSKILAVFRHVR